MDREATLNSRRVAFLTVVFAVILLWLTRQAPPPAGRTPVATENARPSPSRSWQSTTVEAAPGEPSPDAHVEPPAIKAPPSGFCEGPPGPPGFQRPNVGSVVGQWMQEALEAPSLSDGDKAGILKAHQALTTSDATLALSLAEEAMRLAPGVASVQATHGLCARRAGRPLVASESLARAVRMHPGVTVVQRELAEALQLGGHVPEALFHLARYVETQPNDWEAQRRQRLWEVQKEVEGAFVELPDRLFPLRFDPAVPRQRVESLVGALRDSLPRVERLLGPLDDGVAVAVYAERADLLATTCAQGWAHAVYDGRMRFQNEAGGVLSRADAMQAVAAHELTHVVHRRHNARSDGWLVEGVARYVAHEEDAGYQRSRKMLLENGSYIPFSSVMGTLMVLEGHQDSALAYDQSLMMVHWVVDSVGEEGLKALLADPRPNGQEALASVLGIPVDELGARFLQSLKR